MSLRKKNILTKIQQGILAVVVMFQVCETAQGEAANERVIYTSVPILAQNTVANDSVIYLSFSNPSAPNQTNQVLKVELFATGDLFFANFWQRGTTNPTYPIIEGTNLFKCYASETNLTTAIKSGIFGSIAENTNTNKYCRMEVGGSHLTAFNVGTNRQLKIRVRRNVSSDYPADQGVLLKITVSGGGFIVASGSSQQENANGTSYIGGPFTINGGRPF